MAAPHTLHHAWLQHAYCTKRGCTTHIAQHTPHRAWLYHPQRTTRGFTVHTAPRTLVHAPWAAHTAAPSTLHHAHRCTTHACTAHSAPCAQHHAWLHPRPPLCQGRGQALCPGPAGPAGQESVRRCCRQGGCSCQSAMRERPQRGCERCRRSQDCGRGEPNPLFSHPQEVARKEQGTAPCRLRASCTLGAERISRP